MSSATTCTLAWEHYAFLAAFCVWVYALIKMLCTNGEDEDD